MNSDRYTILLVDDEKEILSALYRHFRKDFNCIKALGGEQALVEIEEHKIDLLLCDQRMPKVTGDEVLSYMKEVHPSSIRMLMTGYTDFESLVKSINNGRIYQYVAKPWNIDDLKLTINNALKSLQLERDLVVAKQRVENAYQNTVKMLCVAAEGKDEDTASHIQRVRYYTKAMALADDFSESDSEHIGLMSILHDIGKMYIPDEILKKPGPLDDSQWIEMKKHPAYGKKILGADPFYELAAVIAYGHHENWDGSGYPNSLSEEAIPIEARIVKLADVFDALTTQRPYKEAWPIEKAVDFVVQNKGKLFDPRLVDIFVQLHSNNILQKIKEEYVD